MTDAIAIEMLGADIARRVIEASMVDAAAIKQKLGRQPCLATIIVGNDPSSDTYVRMKQNQCRLGGGITPPCVLRHHGHSGTRGCDIATC